MSLEVESWDPLDYLRSMNIGKSWATGHLGIIVVVLIDNWIGAELHFGTPLE